jgi:hypothetical protein
MVVGGLPGHGDGREVGERREEVEGEDGPGREINRLQLMQHWQRWWGLGRGREVTWEVRGGAESGVGLFIAVERRWSGRGRARVPRAAGGGNGGLVAQFGQS